MSRGFGHVVSNILRHLSDNPRYWLSYWDLATRIYQTDQPSRAQVAAVARAARRLDELGYVVLDHPVPEDRRMTFVMLAS